VKLGAQTSSFRFLQYIKDLMAFVIVARLLAVAEFSAVMYPLCRYSASIVVALRKPEIETRDRNSGLDMH
jgi:hypothetical protein